MKIRNGFVSNSSSSSFVIKLENLTVEQLKQLAKEYSIIIRNEEVQSLDEFESWEVKKRLKELGIDEEHVRWTNIELGDLLYGGHK